MINSDTGEKISPKRVIKKTAEILSSIEGISNPQVKATSLEEIEDNQVRLEIFIKTKIGIPIPKIAQMAQRKLKEEIEEFFKIKVACVDVNVLEVEF